jgi:transposase InsO family protein
MCRYNIPHTFVIDNYKHFNYDSFQQWCAELRIQNYFSTPMHPQANKQVEATKKTMITTLKKKLKDKKGA